MTTPCRRLFAVFAPLLLALPACAGDQQPPASAPQQAEALTHVGAVALALPSGWRVDQRADDGAVLDTGLPPERARDAVVLLVGGELPAEAVGVSATELLRARLPDLAADLRGQGLTVALRRADVVAASCAAGAGAKVALSGRGVDGRTLAVEVHAAADRGRWAGIVAIAVPGAGDAALAGARQAFASLRFPDGPAPQGAPSTAALAGMEFGHATFGRDASLSTTYRFAAGGRVVRRTMFSSPVGSSDREEPGAYTLRGDVVVLRCGDDETTARVERRNGRVVALRIGQARYEALGGR